MRNKKIIVGISGASGVIFGIKLIKYLKDNHDYEIHLAWGNEAKNIVGIETDFSIHEVEKFADFSYAIDDLKAPIASGSFITEGMVIAPCSMSTLGSVANAMPYNLLTRAANVCLKERRKLILLVRESPLHLGYIENMKKTTLSGGIILPPVLAFYNHLKSIDDVVNATLARILDLLNIEHDLCKRWEGKQ